MCPASPGCPIGRLTGIPLPACLILSHPLPPHSTSSFPLHPSICPSSKLASCLLPYTPRPISHSVQSIGLRSFYYSSSPLPSRPASLPARLHPLLPPHQYFLNCSQLIAPTCDRPSAHSAHSASFDGVPLSPQSPTIWSKRLALALRALPTLASEDSSASHTCPHCSRRPRLTSAGHVHMQVKPSPPALLGKLVILSALRTIALCLPSQASQFFCGKPSPPVLSVLLH